MTAIPADIAAAQAAGRIPPDITASYLAESRDQPAKVAILFVGALTFVLLVARCFTRLFLVKKFGLDDALAILTMCLYIVLLGLSIVLIDQGSGRHIEYIQYVLSLDQVNETEVFDFIAHIIYTTALFTCRLSGLAFYHRLAARHNKLSVAIKIAACFLVAVYLVQILLLIFHCLPVTGLWPYAWQPEINHFTCLTWGLVYSVNSGLSLICDLLMLVIPSMLIHLLRVRWQRKVQLSFIMFPGVLVLLISAVRIWLVAVGQWSADGSWAYNPMLAIESSEIGGTLIALSIPALKPLLGSCFSHLPIYSFSRRSRRTSTWDKQKNSNEHDGSSSNNKNNNMKLSNMGGTGHKKGRFFTSDGYDENVQYEVNIAAANQIAPLRDDRSSENLLIPGVTVMEQSAHMDVERVRDGIYLTEEVSVSRSRSTSHRK